MKACDRAKRSMIRVFEPGKKAISCPVRWLRGMGLSEYHCHRHSKHMPLLMFSICRNCLPLRCDSGTIHAMQNVMKRKQILGA
jgi:hypothetical protein